MKVSQLAYVEFEVFSAVAEGDVAVQAMDGQLARRPIWRARFPGRDDKPEQLQGRRL